MKISLKRIDDAFNFEAQNEDGRTVLIDAAEKIGGRNHGVRPTQMLLMALGGCSAIDIASILKKQKQQIDDFQIEVDGERENIKEEVAKVYEARETAIGTENMRRLEKAVLLRTIDEIWMDHIESMEHLRDSVRLRAYGQRDPLVEYKIEGQKMFEQLIETIKAQVANMIFKVSFMEQPKIVKLEERRPDIVGDSHKHQEVISEPAHRQSYRDSAPQVGRNDPCPCGSGKKYKKCHLNRKA